MTDPMSRRSFVKGASTVAAFAIGGQAWAKTDKRQPNIIFIMVDDMGYADLSCTGSSHIKTPEIDNLAANGALLKNGYANSPICSPTRTSVLTGCYQYRFPVGLSEPLGSIGPEEGVPTNRPTIASVLKDQGYSTKLIGKWHLGIPPHHGPLSHGYDDFFGFLEGGADYFLHNLTMNGRNVGRGLFSGITPTEHNGYLTDMLGDEAVRTIETSGDKPFFISLHFNAPHWPWESREDEAIARALKDSSHYDGGSLATYRAMMQAMDDNVGKVIAALKRSGKADNSLIVFTSDNGGERFSQTWPFIGMKGELLEGGIRVPIIAHWPGHIPAGSQPDQHMMSMDFLPTFLAMSGGSVPKATFDGLDLSAQLLGKALAKSRKLFWRFKMHDQSAMRDGDWKYLKLGGKEYLFNLSQDEHERANLAIEESARLNIMKKEWAEWNATMLPYPSDSLSQDNKKNFADRY